MIDFTLAELLTGLDLEETQMQLGGFPQKCFDECSTPGDCVTWGCRKGNGTPPRVIPDESNVATDEAQPGKSER